MKPFRIVPQIAIYQNYGEFADAFSIGSDDLVVTNEYIYTAGMQRDNDQSKRIFQEKYGVGEPSNHMMDAMLADVRKHQFKRVVAVGGGTVIDMAKLLTLGGNHTAAEYFSGQVELRKEKELLLIPTTCGTGSEMTNISILEIKEQNTKKGLATDVLYADYAVLIPGLLKSLPFKVFATSSIDALIHATESFVAPASNQITELFGIRALEMIIGGYQQIVDKGPEHRNVIIEDFLLASAYAGIAFGNTGVGAVHALSYPLGGVYHVPHGEANQQLFTEVFKAYKRIDPVGRITTLEAHLSKLLGVPNASVWKELDSLLESILPRKPLREYGMKRAEIETFADSVLENQQRLLKNNYAPLSRQQMVDIYSQLY
ncbi:4-hydroxybutyrate dehydrogenase|uniref:4-hydroxybutyrate dehydrogenase n=1 Tax=Dendrosporobacter quercicolus TaxID=146817 RepID=A0A1H0A093_9FIRM|nr:4-hydroxybutyrate dehydrogenase [Dendrosporobacter quercicolus]NSL50092.1 4-hydroxybutyrate dehydrogenase [Dendrosporobacter quercicolus DSM 1736]SDN26865.1 4-hydroxybutyrate dehydrogenase [Dendrosporobacter quercicolus]